MNLRKTIVTVEGERDAIFLREITYPLFQTASVQLYKKALLFYDDIRAGKQTDISILYGTGFPGCMELAVHLSRELWYIEDFHSIGVIADSDRGPVYQKTTCVFEELPKHTLQKAQYKPTNN